MKYRMCTSADIESTGQAAAGRSHTLNLEETTRITPF